MALLLDNQTRLAPNEFFPQLGSGGGSSNFQSTFAAVPLPANTSTTLIALPPGQWGFNGEAIASGSAALNAGFVSVLSNATTNINRGNLNATETNQPADVAPIVPTLNFGDNPLSTIKLIVANNGSVAGTWTGIVSRLY